MTAPPPEADLEMPGVHELREALRRGEVSSRELVEQALARAEAAQGLGAFISLNPELALAEADAADARIAATAPDARKTLPPLLGVPTAHKDLVAVRGTVTTHGSAAVPHTAAASDDPVAAAVRAAGAVSIGKTQVPEFGIAGYSENEIASPARNPYDRARTAGGSSGGTAAAIAAGVIPGAIASDAGGSIRIPSAACGLVGLKPGRGAVPADLPAASAEPGADPAFDELGAPRMGVSGPIARGALDAAVLYDALLGRADEPAATATRRILDAPGSLRGLRIGLSLASPFEGWTDLRFDTAAIAALEAGAAALTEAGHAVEEADVSYDPRYPEAFTTVWTAGLARIDFGGDPDAATEGGASADAALEKRLGALAGMFLHRARTTTRTQLLEAAAALRSFAAEAARQWGAYDLVLTPALAFTAPLVGAFRELGPEGDYRLQCQWAPQTSMVNVAGLPAITVPTGVDAHGLPRGVQLIGRAGDEVRLLQLAVQLAA